VFRFHGGDGLWKAAMAGPYLANAPEGPLHGQSTFSRFERWESKTAEEHAMAIFDNLADWRADFAKR